MAKKLLYLILLLTSFFSNGATTHSNVVSTKKIKFNLEINHSQNSEFSSIDFDTNNSFDFVNDNDNDNNEEQIQENLKSLDGFDSCNALSCISNTNSFYKTSFPQTTSIGNYNSYNLSRIPRFNFILLQVFRL